MSKKSNKNHRREREQLKRITSDQANSKREKNQGSPEQSESSESTPQLFVDSLKKKLALKTQPLARAQKMNVAFPPGTMGGSGGAGGRSSIQTLVWQGQSRPLDLSSLKKTGGSMQKCCRHQYREAYSDQPIVRQSKFRDYEAYEGLKWLDEPAFDLLRPIGSRSLSEAWRQVAPRDRVESERWTFAAFHNKDYSYNYVLTKDNGIAVNMDYHSNEGKLVYNSDREFPPPTETLRVTVKDFGGNEVDYRHVTAFCFLTEDYFDLTIGYVSGFQVKKDSGIEPVAQPLFARMRARECLSQDGIWHSKVVALVSPQHETRTNLSFPVALNLGSFPVDMPPNQQILVYSLVSAIDEMLDGPSGFDFYCTNCPAIASMYDASSLDRLVLATTPMCFDCWGASIDGGGSIYMDSVPNP